MPYLFSMPIRRPLVIESIAGSGKSTELAIAYLEITNNPRGIVLFFDAVNAKDFPVFKKSMERTLEAASKLGSGKQIAVLFDGIDEIDGDSRVKTLELLRTMAQQPNTHVIASSRPGEFNPLRNEAMILHLLPIGPDQRVAFLKVRMDQSRRVPEKMKKIEKTIDFLSSDQLSNEIRNTPLILFFLCKLSMTDAGLDGIWNRAKLYEGIVK